MRRATSLTADVIDEASVNLTPLIDVVFVVLITFIVVAPLLEMDQVALAPGKGSIEEMHAVGDNSPVVLHVRSNDAIVLNGRTTDLSQLPTQLAALHAAHPTTAPQLFHDRNARFGTYQAIKQAVEGAGFEQVDVILEPL